MAPREGMDQNVARWRAETPGCARRIHLNNAGAGLMPESVVQAIKRHVDLEATIGGYEATAQMEPEIAGTYDSVAALINGRRENIALASSATGAFVKALSSFDFAPGDVIVTTRNDYPSYQIQLLALAKRQGVQVSRAEDLPEGDFRRNQPRLQGENYDRNMALVARLRGLATRVGASPAQVALGWLLGQGPDVVPIFGTTRRARLRENLAAVSLKLAACDQFLLDQTFAPDTVSGARYNEAGLALLDRG